MGSSDDGTCPRDLLQGLVPLFVSRPLSATMIKFSISIFSHFRTHLAYGWSAGNLNRPIRIQQAGKILVSWCKVDKSGKALKSGTFLTGDGVRYPRKGNHTSWRRLKSVNHFVFLNFYFGAKNARHGNSLVVRRVSQGRMIIMLFWTKYAVPRQFEPGILKLTTSRGKRNLLNVFISVRFEEKGCYRIVSWGHQNFDCRSYCGLSRRMQGEI